VALARCRSVVLLGVQARRVDVEVHLGGVPGFSLVGLPDTSVQEARDRVRAAVLSSGEAWPQQRITANLSPASLHKHGTHFDLALALAVLAAAGAVPAERTADLVVMGELGLDGRVRPVPGVLPAVMAGAAGGARRFVVPAGNLSEARVVDGVEVLGVSSLRALLAALRGEPPDEAEPVRSSPASAPGPGVLAATEGDLADVAGQPVARRLVEVAAAGRHHLMLSGPPGTGKTMLARRLPGLLPTLDLPDALEVSAVHSVAGLIDPEAPLVRRPPFVDPHHTSSAAALVGGGSGVPRPGAVSLAHRGVLLLDEAPEFTRPALESLRQPLERGEVLIQRARGTGRFPAQFQLVLTANPCPCGFAGSVVRHCTCPPDAVRRYQHRISGPLLDRIDLHGAVGAVSRAALVADAADRESSQTVRARVAAARARQAARFAGCAWSVNADMPSAALTGAWRLPRDVMRPLTDAVARGALSARGADRVQRVSWTLADLASDDVPTREHVEEAMAFHRGAVGLVVA
jgi:magnesium chelatase family protein